MITKTDFLITIILKTLYWHHIKIEKNIFYNFWEIKKNLMCYSEVIIIIDLIPNSP